MATRDFQSPLPPTFSKSPKRDTSPKLAGERNVRLAQTPDEVRSMEVGKAGDTTRIMEWNSASWVWIIVVPVVVWCLLLVLMPTFVKKGQDGNKLDHQSMLLWTLILSLIVWILFFGFAKCKSC
jgi:hypothetical protein